MNQRRLLLLTTRLMSSHSYCSVESMEKIIPCSDGIKLAALHWTRDETTSTPTSSNPLHHHYHHHRILCLHGWLDNASSFEILAPSLIKSLSSPANLDSSTASPCKVDIVAIDHVGHGKSMHKSADSTMIFTEFAYYVAETMKFLQWDTRTDFTTTTTLIGHSMGAAISLLYAAAFPEQVDRLILLDGVGPTSRNSAHAAQHVRDSITKRLASNPTLFPHLNSSHSEWTNNGVTKSSRQRVYTSLDAAIEARLSTNYAFQENLYMSREAAHALVSRGTKSFSLDINNKDKDDDNENFDSTGSNNAVVFSHDQRLKWPSSQYYTKEQTEALYNSLKCPTHLILAQDGYLIQNGGLEIITNLQKEIKNLLIEKASGSHHFHADPETAEEVVEYVHRFILNPVTGNKIGSI